MPTLGEMRSTREKPAARTFLIATPMKHGGGYDGPTSDFLVALADRGMKRTGFMGTMRDYGGSTELSRARLAATFVHKTKADDLVFLDADNALDLDTFDALMAVDGDVVGVPYLRRVPPHIWCARLSLENYADPKLRRCGDERLLSVLGAGTGVLRITRDAMRRTWEHFPELKREWEPGPYLVAIFNGMPSLEPDVVLDPETGGLRTVPRSLPGELMDDYGFCERARAAGCRVEVLVDRWATHAGIHPEASLGAMMWPDGKPTKRDVRGT